MPRHGHFCTTHTLTHTQKQTDGCIWLHSCPVSTPLPLVWHHLFWVVWPCFISTVGTLVLNCISSVHLCTLQMLYIHDFGGKWRWHHLFKCDHFQAFSNTEETQHTYGCFIPFFSFVCFISLSLSFTEDQMLLSQASRDLKLIFSPLLMNAKIIYNVTWKRESCIALSINFLSVKKKRSLYASTATWRNAMYVFGSANKPNHRVII